jgi:hypothetical protein
MKKIDVNKQVAQFNLAQVMSNKHNEQKEITEPFLKRLLRDREHCSEPEQKLYEFIIQNWLWCIPIWKNIDKDSKRRLVGYRMLDKEEVMKQAFDFG